MDSRMSFLLELLDWDYIILGFIKDEDGTRCVEWDAEDEPELVKQVVARMTDGVSGRACNRVKVYEIKKIEDIHIKDKKEEKCD
ncbi:MAG: hypothetical protein SVM80_06480 [Halobacteriota archaeon]|nr:hypothetical protein [Halobacteriota archaeon]